MTDKIKKGEVKVTYCPTAVHRSVLENGKDKSGNVKTTRSNTRLNRNRAVIGGGDGNSKL